MSKICVEREVSVRHIERKTGRGRLKQGVSGEESESERVSQQGSESERETEKERVVGAITKKIK